VPQHLLGKDSFQEVDSTGITMSITKHNYIVRDVTKLAGVIREAFDIARCGRPGPVLIDIPKDVTAALAEYESKPLASCERSETVARCASKIPTPSASELDRACELLSSAKKPFFYAGGGVVISDASPELVALAEKLNAPVAVSLMGKTAIPVRHPLCTGMIGMHGTKASNTGANHCDLLVAVGARFSDRVISDPSRFAREAKVLQIDIDPAEINKNVRTEACLTGDISSILAELVKRVKARPRDEWNESVDEWKTHVPSMYSKKTPLHPKFVLERVHARVGDEAIITTEVGQHQMWVAQFYPFAAGRTFLTSGGLGTMGYGTGAAIGAQVACPNRRVVHIAGDGSFRMNLNELATISHYKLPIVIIVANNGTLGMVRQWQKMFYDKRYSQTTLDRPPDFLKLADAFDVMGFRATDEAGFAKAFDEALESKGPALIDCYMDIDEMVFPMVPAGKPIDELLLDA
jgi:acetolactate synthase-1/2/3 large subunit